jgi:hypothetical protein
VALIRKARSQSDLGDGHFELKQALACSANAQAMDKFANALPIPPAEDPREVDRMHSGFAAQLVKGQLLVILGADFIENSTEPRRPFVGSFSGSFWISF